MAVTDVSNTGRMRWEQVRMAASIAVLARSRRRWKVSISTME